MTAKNLADGIARGARTTLAQRRAQHAWNAVQRARKKSGPHREQDLDKFAAEVKKLPIRILTSGLGKALAYLEAKKKDVPGLLEEISDWVLNHRYPSTNDGGNDLLDRILRGDSDFLRRVTEEVLEYSEWLTRFCEAAPEGGSDGES